MQIVILAAGQGSRLGDVHTDAPKSLVQMGDKPYLSYQLQFMRACTDAEIIVVGGYCSPVLETFLTEAKIHNVRLVHNAQFTKGNLLSVLSARPYLNDDFFIFNADHCYPAQTYQHIFKLTAQDGIHVCCDHDRILASDDMKVKLTSDARFQSMSKTLETYELGYVGVSHVSKSLQGTYWQLCEEALRDKGESVHVEHVMNCAAQSGLEIGICDISGSWWTEIDTPEDLDKARVVFAKQGLI